MTISEGVNIAHEDAVNKGFYTCNKCNGTGEHVVYNDITVFCQECKGTGIGKRNIGEALMLIVSELGEAMEAHRQGHVITQQVPHVYKPLVEQWKFVPFNHNYMVSNWGNVKSLDRCDVQSRNGLRKQYGRVLSAGLSKTGYYTVSIEKRTHKVAWLVAEAFIGARKGKVVNHINGDKTCDWVTNLEYTTMSGNNQHAICAGLVDRTKKLTLKDKINIAFRFKNKESAPSIHKDYPQVTLSAIKRIRFQGINKYTDSLEFELADAVIRVFDLCGYMNIDLENHILRKLEYNRGRPEKHGKKY